MINTVKHHFIHHFLCIIAILCVPFVHFYLLNIDYLFETVQNRQKMKFRNRVTTFLLNIFHVQCSFYSQCRKVFPYLVTVALWQNILTYNLSDVKYNPGLFVCIFVCGSVRYAGIFTAGLVLYRVGVEFWNMLPHLNQYCVCCCHCCYIWLILSCFYFVNFTAVTPFQNKKLRCCRDTVRCSISCEIVISGHSDSLVAGNMPTNVVPYSLCRWMSTTTTERKVYF